MGWLVDGVFVVAATEVLDEGVTGGDDASGADRLDTAHWSQPSFESTVVGLYSVIGVLLGHVPRTGHELVDIRG